jgi:signal transduction histidine kinase
MEHQLLELTTLQAIGQSLTSTLDQEVVLKRVVEAAGYFTDAQESTLFLLDQDADELVLQAYHGLERSRPPDLRLQLSSSPLAEAINTGEPLFMSSGTSDYSIKLQTGFLVHSLLYVPLQIHQAPIGVLGVTDKLSGQDFTPDDARLLTSLGSYAAVAIENARLNESQKQLARAETVKQMIVTLSHYIKNPLTAISLSTYDLGSRHDQKRRQNESDALKRNLQMIDMNVKEITAVMAILQELASPQSTTYVNGIQMIDIEEQVQERVRKIREEYPELDELLNGDG